ncbi:MAG TPA: ABC transporter permease [Vicinamibacterales bacterium]
MLLLSELRFAFRRLGRTPFFACCSVAAIAMVIALNTTVFALLEGALHPVSPIPEPERLWTASFPRSSTVDPEIADTRVGALTRALGSPENLALVGVGGMNGGVVVHTADSDVPSVVAGVSPGYWVTLAVHPVAGRLFRTAGDARDGTAVITEGLWHRLTGDRAEFKSFAIRAGDTPLTVIGVIAQGSAYPPEVEVFRAVDTVESFGRVLVRLPSGRDPAQAAADIVGRTRALLSSANANDRVALEPAFFQSARVVGTHLALLLAGACLLILACGNIAAIQADRIACRIQDVFVRQTLGGSRIAIVAALSAEAIILGIVGGGVGLIISVWAIPLLRAVVPAALSATGLVEPRLSWRVVLASEALVGGILLVIGLVPSLRSSMMAPADCLRAGHATTVSRAAIRRGRIAVILEVASALALVIMAMLLADTARRLDTMDVGYDPTRLLAIDIRLRGRGDSSRVRESAVRAAAMVDRIQRIQGVDAVATTYFVAPDHQFVSTIDHEGHTRETMVRRINSRIVSANFVTTLGLSLVTGRTPPGSAEMGPFAIVDETAARLLWPGIDPVGQVLKLGDRTSPRPWVRVSRVTHRVALLAANCLRVECFQPSVFVVDQNLEAYGSDVTRSAEFIVRTSNVAAVERTLSHGGWADSPNLFYAVEAWNRATGFESLRRSQQMIAAIFVAFALAGLALATFGAFAVVSLSVGQRRKEFGIRLALGARSGDLVRLVLREVRSLVLAGIAFGLLLSGWAERTLAVLVFHTVDLWAPVYFIIAVLLIAIAIVAAALRPALQSGRLDPMAVLRTE